MRVLIYGLNYSPEKTGVGVYTSGMAEWLSSRGHEVCVLTAQPYYPEWKIHKGFRNRFSSSSDGKVEVWRCPVYVPNSGTIVRRMLHLLSFAFFSLLQLPNVVRWRPDLIIHIAPTLISAPNAIVFSKITKAASILHIQDFEFDAMLGAKGPTTRFVRGVFWGVESFHLKRYSYVSTISDGMINRLVQKGVDMDKILYLPNWAALDLRDVNPERWRAEVKNHGVKPDKDLILYSGNIGEKQGLELLLSAAQLYAERDDLQFLIVGDGMAKDKLRLLARQMSLRNVVFLPLQPKARLASMLSAAKCHVVVQKEEVGDSVLPSKIGNIFACGGNAVITATKMSALGRLCDSESGLAVRVAPNSLKGLCSGIDRALSLPTPNQVSLRYAKRHLDQDGIFLGFSADLVSKNFEML